tara:strand:+ start:688 stop:1677 length:990 start_codon:yes stop_codon:yes gene_type:complete
MANAVFSPKDFQAWVIEESTPGTALTFTSAAYQLDVDSVAFPSLNPNQVLGVRSRAGRVLHQDDFFQDNTMRAIEVTLAGTFHIDGGHVMLMQSVAGNDLTPASIADVSVSATATGVTGKYGVAQDNATFTLILAPPDYSDGYNTVLKGCQCTSFTLSADSGTDGGVYKFSATISTGVSPTTNDSDNPGGNAFSANHISLSTLSAKKVYAVDVVMSSFDVTMESPAVYGGFSSSGYEAFARGEEISITANANVKYDSATRPLYHSFNSQSVHKEDNCFTMTQTTATDCSISMPDGVLTDVTFNEGDMMMLDVALKAVTGDHAAIIFDLA